MSLQCRRETLTQAQVRPPEEFSAGFPFQINVTPEKSTLLSQFGLFTLRVQPLSEAAGATYTRTYSISGRGICQILTGFKADQIGNRIAEDNPIPIGPEHTYRYFYHIDRSKALETSGALM